MAVTPDKVQIGSSNDFLDGVAVDTAAGTGLFRETVVLADPEAGGGLANVRELSVDLQGTDKGIVTNTVIHGLTTAGHGAYVDVKVNPSGALAVDATGSSVEVSNFPATQQIKDTTDLEYTPVATTLTAAGDTTVYTPAAGKRIRLHWIYAINDPVATSSTKITVKMGANTYYVAWDIAKRQQFTGPVDGALVINLSAVGNVAVTVFLEEV